MVLGETLKVLSASCQGLREKKKRYDVINYFDGLRPNIICFQDTHLTKKEIDEIAMVTGYETYISGSKTNARGVAFLIKNNFEYKVKNFEDDDSGNWQVIDVDTASITLRIVNIYAPNSESPEFFSNLTQFIENNEQDYLIICGDFNLVLDPNLDYFNYKNVNNPISRKTVLDILQTHNLRDAFRSLNPSLRRYTWRRKNPIKQARLDYFIVSNSLMDITSACKIKPGYRSDHSIQELNIIISKFQKGRGVWKFNCSLLKNQQYLTLINKQIEEVIQTYTIPVYNLDYISSNNVSNLQFTIEDHLLLEMILLKIREVTIGFSIHVKELENVLEKNILSDIENIANASPCPLALELLDNKNKELQKLRETKMQGQMVRSRVQWLHAGEKPSKYFASLERKNFIDKTIKCVSMENGDSITDQAEILNKVHQFYEKLFKSKDDSLPDFNLTDYFKNEPIVKLTEMEATSIEGPVSLNELSTALKMMKNNKTPGIDGFPSEFFKVFWCKLKHIICRALNYSYQKGKLSVTLRQSLINCIPKGDKPRQFLKNWRPISLLTVLYKLLSSAISQRLKQFLDKLIAKSQTGFIQGRFIGDSTRLIYDIMHYTEIKKIKGLLVLLDFEKAFDSISWKFMYGTLKFFNFTDSFIRWIKLLNTDIEASIIQAGVKSKTLQIGRGCKQGDPIAAYLFILCGQILNYMISKNIQIKGIIVGDEEFKLTQFADDTTLILDGSHGSLIAALNTIEIFGNYSGLKMNTSKTKVIWIGSKKHCKDKIDNFPKLDWEGTEFKLLGILFSVNLNDMVNLNYVHALETVNKISNNWKKRNLTPLGRVTVIKTFLVTNLIIYS